MIWYKLQNSIIEIDVVTAALMLCKLVMYDKRADFASYILWFTYMYNVLSYYFIHIFYDLGVVLWRWTKINRSL